jgi:hypothetical protein
LSEGRLDYTDENDQAVAIVDENRIEECFAAHIVHNYLNIVKYCYT